MKMSRIWASNNKEVIMTELTEDMLAINIFADDMVVGVIITREEANMLALGISEWVGLPMFYGDEEE